MALYLYFYLDYVNIISIEILAIIYNNMKDYYEIKTIIIITN